tara:strand:- start:104 stop:910 length:807 start_codon:yes stop_codon:yes gene_type:complete
MREYTFTEKCDTVTKYFKEVSKSELLTIEKEVEIATRIQQGDENAINELVEGNLKFVISIAKEYQGLGLPLSDLISEGNYGLIKSALNFDPTRGFRFISYAVHWVKMYIIKSLNDNSRIIRLPVNVINKLSKLNKTAKLDDSTLNHPEYENKYPSCISLNSPMDLNSSGVTREIIDYIPNGERNHSECVDDDSVILKDAINNTLTVLSDRERGIVECYYGLNSDYEPMTLEAIGDRYSLSKERIRQIKKKAIRRLRHNNDELYSLLNE